MDRMDICGLFCLFVAIPLGVFFGAIGMGIAVVGIFLIGGWE
jgi:hypothetical protein